MYIFATKHNKKNKIELMSHIDGTVELSDVPIKAKNYFDLFQEFNELVKKEKEARLIVVDDYGIAPFMVASKFPNLVCAQALNEYSAKMSREHNNANVVILAYNLTSLPMMLSIIDIINNAQIGDESHLVRLDMMKEELA